MDINTKLTCIMRLGRQLQDLKSNSKNLESNLR